MSFSFFALLLPSFIILLEWSVRDSTELQQVQAHLAMNCEDWASSLQS